MDDCKKEIQKLFRNYSRMDHKLIRKLGEYGLSVTSSGSNHWRVENKSNHRITYVSLTPSDWRAGRNAAKNIYELLDAA